MTNSKQASREGRGLRAFRAILRRLLRFAAWSLGVAGVALLLVGVVAFVVYLNRARVVNQVLGVIVAPYQVSVEDIDFYPLGEVRIEDLRLKPKGSTSDRPLAAIPEVDITYEFAEIRRTQRLKTVTLREPSFYLDDAHLEAYARRRQRSKRTNGGFTLARLAIFTDSFRVEDGAFELALDDVPATTADWNFRSGPLRFDETGKPRESFRLELSDVRLGEGGDGSRIDELTASARMTRDLSRIDVESVDAEGVKLRVTPEWIDALTGPGADPPPPAAPQADATGSSASSNPVDLHLHALRLGRASIGLTGFDGRDGGVALPDITFETTSEFENLHLVDGRLGSEDPLSLVAETFNFGGGETPFLSADRVAVTVDSLGDLVRDRRIADLSIRGADMILSDDTLTGFRSQAPEKDGAKPDDEAAPRSGEKSEPRPWIITRATVEDGNFLQTDMSYGDAPAPRLETRVSGELEDLRFGGGQVFDSDGRQSVRLENARLWPPGVPASNAPLIALESAEAAGPWSRFADERLVERLHVQGLDITFTDASLGDWLEPDAPPSPQTAAGERPVYKVADLEVTGGVLEADSTFAGGRVPQIVSDFSVSTDAEAGAPYSYRAVFENFRLHNRPVRVENTDPEPRPEDPNADIPNLDPVAREEVFTVREITVDATAADLQRDRRIDRVRLSNARLDVGRGLKAVVDAATKAEEESPPSDADDREAPPPPDPAPEPGDDGPTEDDEPASDAQAANGPEHSRARESVAETPQPNDPDPDNDPDPERSRARESVAETPQPNDPDPDPDPDGETESPIPGWTIDRLQVTRSQVRFETLIPQVQGLEFAVETTLEDVPLSLEGLLAQDKIQKVELAGLEIKDPYDSFITVAFLPTIFVEFSLAGLAQQEVEKVDLIAPSLHVGQGLFWWIEYQREFRAQNEGASVAIEQGDEVTTAPNWTIKRIDATAGKIVIAPTGVPIGVVPVPFNASTTMEEGNIELALNIPEGKQVYRFPDYEVNLHGLTGDVQFNVPVKQVDNNLVQTFTLDRAVWKDYEAEELYLSVTFDENGVYGDFGGEAYGGYAEGAFNVYLNDSGKWDAWVAGTEMNTGPLTDAMIPENFQMEGEVSLEIVSEGRGKKLGETTGEFQTSTPGWFDITQFDEILEKLPEEWTNLQRSLTELGLIALKRFSYDKGSGRLYLQGRDGELQVRFTGPHGNRNLNLHLHDERNTPAGSGGDGPRPAADVRPADRDP